MGHGLCMYAIARFNRGGCSLRRCSPLIGGPFIGPSVFGLYRLDEARDRRIDVVSECVRRWRGPRHHVRRDGDDGTVVSGHVRERRRG